MKKTIVTVTLAAVFLFSLAAFAGAKFLIVTAPPHCEVAGSASVAGVSTLYLTIEPSAEIAKPTTIVTVYEDDVEIWSGKAKAVDELKIATYWADEWHDYDVVIEETDGIYVTAILSYD